MPGHNCSSRTGIRPGRDVYSTARTAEFSFCEPDRDLRHCLLGSQFFELKTITAPKECDLAGAAGALEHKLLMGMPARLPSCKVRMLLRRLDVNISPGGCSWLTRSSRSTNEPKKMEEAILAAFAGDPLKHVYVVDPDIDIYEICLQSNRRAATRF